MACALRESASPRDRPAVHSAESAIYAALRGRGIKAQNERGQYGRQTDRAQLCEMRGKGYGRLRDDDQVRRHSMHQLQRAYNPCANRKRSRERVAHRPWRRELRTALEPADERVQRRLRAAEHPVLPGFRARDCVIQASSLRPGLGACPNQIDKGSCASRLRLYRNPIQRLRNCPPPFSYRRFPSARTSVPQFLAFSHFAVPEPKSSPLAGYPDVGSAPPTLARAIVGPLHGMGKCESLRLRAHVPRRIAHPEKRHAR